MSLIAIVTSSKVIMAQIILSWVGLGLGAEGGWMSGRIDLQKKLILAQPS